MSDFSYAVDSTDDYLFGISQQHLRDNPELLRQLLAIDGIDSEQEAAGRLAMIIAAANDLGDMDRIYLGSVLNIPENEVVIGVASATTDVERNQGNLRAVYNVVEPAYRNGGKETIQAAISSFEPGDEVVQQQQVQQRDPEPLASTITPEASQALVVATTEYYMASAAYYEMVETLPEAQRIAAQEAMKTPDTMATTIAEQYPNNPALQAAAARVQTASDNVGQALGSDGLGKETTAGDKRSILSNLRVSAAFDEEPTTENALRATNFSLKTSRSRLDATTIMGNVDRATLDAAIAANVASAPSIEPQQVQSAGNSFRLQLEGKTNFDFTDLAELPLNDAQYRDGADTVNASGGMNARDQLGRLRDDVRQALITNGVVEPTEKQVTQATAYILAVENGEDRRGDKITNSGEISIPSTTEANAAVAVFAPAMMAANGKRLSGGEQRDALEEVQAAVTPNAVAASAEIAR